MEHLDTLTALAPIIGGMLAVLAAIIRLAAALLQRQPQTSPTEQDTAALVRRLAHGRQTTSATAYSYLEALRPGGTAPSGPVASLPARPTIRNGPSSKGAKAVSVTLARQAMVRVSFGVSVTDDRGHSRTTELRR